MIQKFMNFFKSATTEGVLKMTPEQHERHSNIQAGIGIANDVYGDILDDLSPEDKDSPGVLTVAELGVLATERLGARAKNS
jgi:hypothetical protein